MAKKRSNFSDFLSAKPRNIEDLLDSTIVQRLQHQKRGQGFGKDYKPFLVVQDVQSEGRSHRRPAKTHGRIVNLLSDLELAAFLVFDWADSVIDIREQYPLNPVKTLSIAKRQGIRHPSAKGVIQVMTTDLLLDIERGGKIIRKAVSMKYRTELENARVIEKQELERRFWESEQIDWYLFTENEIPKTLFRNIKWVVPHLHSFELDEISQRSTFELILQTINLHSDDRVGAVMSSLDERMGVEDGTYLQYLRHLLAQGAFFWNMIDVDHRSLKTRHIVPSRHWMEEDYEYVHAE